MNTEFHYWITGIIADHAGFDQTDTRIIAYSSQFVDDNDDDISVFNDEFDVTPSYINHISQTMNFLLPRKDLMEIYPIFHFIPGDQGNAAKRKDGKVHPLNTTPDSSYAKQIIQAALDNAATKYKNNDKCGLYRLGIATHSFVDTWAHQNFTGSCDDFGDMGNACTPNVGHADALHHPDWVGHRWNDDRLVAPNINNNTRFISAARRIYYLFSDFQASIGNAGADKWSELEPLLLGIYGTTYSGDSEKGAAERTEKYMARVPWLPDYDDGDWQTAALEVKTVRRDGGDDYVERYFWKKGINPVDTDWFKFQDAVKEQIVSAKEILQHVFALAGLNA